MLHTPYFKPPLLGFRLCLLLFSVILSTLPPLPFLGFSGPFSALQLFMPLLAVRVGVNHSFCFHLFMCNKILITDAEHRSSCDCMLDSEPRGIVQHGLLL